MKVFGIKVTEERVEMVAKLRSLKRGRRGSFVPPEIEEETVIETDENDDTEEEE